MDAVEKYHTAVNHLCGLVVESMETNPSYLLSPVMRKMVVEHAKKTESLRQLLAQRCRLYPDNPTDKPLLAEEQP